MQNASPSPPYRQKIVPIASDHHLAVLCDHVRHTNRQGFDSLRKPEKRFARTRPSLVSHAVLGGDFASDGKSVGPMEMQEIAGPAHRTQAERLELAFPVLGRLGLLLFPVSDDHDRVAVVAAQLDPHAGETFGRAVGAVVGGFGAGARDGGDHVGWDAGGDFGWNGAGVSVLGTDEGDFFDGLGGKSLRSRGHVRHAVAHLRGHVRHVVAHARHGVYKATFRP